MLNPLFKVNTSLSGYKTGNGKAIFSVPQYSKLLIVPVFTNY